MRHICLESKYEAVHFEFMLFVKNCFDHPVFFSFTTCKATVLKTLKPKLTLKKLNPSILRIHGIFSNQFTTDQSCAALKLSQDKFCDFRCLFSTILYTSRGLIMKPLLLSFCVCEVEYTNESCKCVSRHEQNECWSFVTGTPERFTLICFVAPVPLSGN